ncbi:MAG: hypothetical protein R6W75_11340, partial [Smithellaceae bacterium]
HNLLSHVKLLHFHIGSQITKIDKIKNALIEGSRIYAEMRTTPKSSARKTPRQTLPNHVSKIASS